MRPDRRTHYDVVEKTEIIQQHTGLEKPYAEQLSRSMDSFTFAELKYLATSIRIIAQGKKLGE